MNTPDSDPSATGGEIPDSVLQRMIAADENPGSAAAADPSVPRCLSLLQQASSGAADIGEFSERATASTSDATSVGLGRVYGAATPASIGRFRIIRRLGHGAYGIVWLGLDADLQRLAAVKVPRLLTMIDGKRRKRFLRESKAAAALDHPNIVTVYETGFDGELAFIATAYCAGGTLEDYLAKELTLSTKIAAQIALTLADAIGHAHDRGVVHRDLKPSNLFVGADPEHALPEISSATLPDRIQIADFGLAMIQSELADATATEGIIGTPAYMAPEQARGDAAAVGPVTDIYAIGVILYRMLTGRTPLVDDDSFALLKKITVGRFVRPQLLRSELHRDLEAICLKCLALDPADRYASAKLLRADLQNHLDGRPVSARPYRFTDAWVAWMKREPVVACLAALSALLLVTVIAGSLVAARVFRTQRDDLRSQLDATNVAKSETERVNRALSQKLNEASADHMMRLFDEAIESGKATATQYMERGERAMNFGQYEKARGDFLTAMEMAPENAHGYSYLSWLLVCGSEEILDPECALELSLKSREISSNPNHYSLLHCHGFALYANGRYQEALDALVDALEGDPVGGHSLTWSYRAMAEFQLGLRRRAELSLARATEIRHARDETNVFFNLNFERAQRLIHGAEPRLESEK